MAERDLDDLRASQVSIMLQGRRATWCPTATRSRTSPSPALGPATYARSAGAARDPGRRRARRPCARLLARALGRAAASWPPVAVALAPRPGLLARGRTDEPARPCGQGTPCWTPSPAPTGTSVRPSSSSLTTRPSPRVCLVTVTIRDGKIGGEGRLGEEYAVGHGDGFLPLPAHVLPVLPPGTLVRVQPTSEGFLLAVQEQHPSPTRTSRESLGPLRVKRLDGAYGDVVAVPRGRLRHPTGGMLAITGPSGAGKTSLLWPRRGSGVHRHRRG